MYQCMYRGHKCVHCLTSHTFTSTDGLKSHLFGPFEGIKTEACQYQRSALKDALRLNLDIDGLKHQIYGNQAYVLIHWIQTDFPPVFETEAQQLNKNSMKSAKRAFYWSYGESKERFTTKKSE